MSSTETRRPIRLLSAAEIAQLQQQQAPRSDAQAATLQSADRFRRTLAGSSRRAEAAAGPAPPPKSPAVRDAPANPAVNAALLRLADAAAGASEDEHASVEQATTTAAVARHSLGTHEPPHAGRNSTDAAGEGLAVPEISHDPWPQQMAETIAGLCARASPSFVNWTVTLPMDPQVLPETDLRLSLSQHWLSLRFLTQSPTSHQLVCRYRQSLLEQLEHMPNLPHGIDIEVT